jgi:kanamycin nucleotidyltransferase
MEARMPDGMTHDQRVALANEIAERILAEYGEQIVAIAVYGSTAKGEDGPYSDLDIWVATTSEFPKDDVHLVYRDVTVDLSYVPAERLLQDARRVGPYWPVQAGSLRSYLLLFDRAGLAARLQEAAGDPPDEAFREALVGRMSRMHECAGKLRNAWQRHEREGVLHEARWVAYNAVMALGIINRRYYPGSHDYFELSKELPIKPRDYDRLLDVAGGFVTCEPAQCYRAALELWEALQHMALKQGAQWVTDELPC